MIALSWLRTKRVCKHLCLRPSSSGCISSLAGKEASRRQVVQSTRGCEAAAVVFLAWKKRRKPLQGKHLRGSRAGGLKTWQKMRWSKLWKTYVCFACDDVRLCGLCWLFTRFCFLFCLFVCCVYVLGLCVFVCVRVCVCCGLYIREHGCLYKNLAILTSAWKMYVFVCHVIIHEEY